MTIIHSLKQLILQNITSKAAPKDSYFSTNDLQYAYSQHYLLPETAPHFNFSKLSGNMTGTYRHKTDFYSLTDKPVEFEKATETTSIRITNTYFFRDDILIISS